MRSYTKLKELFNIKDKEMKDKKTNEIGNTVYFNTVDELFEGMNFHWDSISFASNELRHNRKLNLFLLSKNYGYFEVMSSYFTEDKDLVRELLKEYPYIYQFLKEEWKKDKEFIDICISSNGYSITLMDKSFLQNRELILKAIKTYGGVLECLSDELRQDRELVIESIKQNGLCIQYIKCDLDDELIEIAVNQNQDVLELDCIKKYFEKK